MILYGLLKSTHITRTVSVKLSLEIKEEIIYVRLFVAIS